MKSEQRVFTQESGWKDVSPERLSDKPQLVLAFGGRALAQNEATYNDLHAQYPEAHVLLCSTAGEILDTKVTDNSVVATAIHFDSTTLKTAQVNIASGEESLEAGKQLASQLSPEGLVHVMVFSDGLKVNGTELVKGLVDNLPATVSATGGLVGDGSDFKETYVGLDSVPAQGKIVAIGFYGEHLKVGYGSLGGWDTFGPERLITKATNNVLYELDNKPALALYKEYLGDQAKDLPSSGLLFPLSLRIKQDDGSETEVVRTLLSVNEDEQSMTFAGDLPVGIYARLMKANFDRLIDGASGAASMSITAQGENKPELAILISCIGRKLVLKERIEEEVEATRSIVGPQAAICGFYSYGELCPVSPTTKQCQLHNQTMTITTLSESA